MLSSKNIYGPIERGLLSLKNKMKEHHKSTLDRNEIGRKGRGLKRGCLSSEKIARLCEKDNHEMEHPL